MIKLLKKLFICCISIVTLVTITACSSQSSVKINGENIGEYLPDILENEKKIENIFIGSGLPTVPNVAFKPDSKGQCFVEVNDKDFDTISKLKEQTEKVFTASYAKENFYKFAFDENYARYKEVDGKLCIDIGLGGALDREWVPSSFKFISENNTNLTITVEYMNYNSMKKAEIIFLKSDGKLLIDKLSNDI